MKVKDVIESKGGQVWTIDQDKTVYEALGVLVDKKIGAIVVMGPKGSITGIVSERDIIRECFRNSKNLEKSFIKDIMTRQLIVGKPEDELDYIMGIMTKNRIRHVPIISGGKLQGIVSIGDVVKAQLQSKEYENHYLKDYMFGTGPGGR
ncbi:MAG TPA: CBS domain-containing protein [bacterium]|nr:CBS domain-containing protein [bacterium]